MGQKDLIPLRVMTKKDWLSYKKVVAEIKRDFVALNPETSFGASKESQDFKGDFKQKFDKKKLLKLKQTSGSLDVEVRDTVTRKRLCDALKHLGAV